MLLICGARYFAYKLFYKNKTIIILARSDRIGEIKILLAQASA